MENLEIKAEIKSLKKILCDEDFFYQIPDYQRPYAWNKDNLSDLIDDLFNAYQNSQKEKYFCGSLVLVYNKKSKRYDIIDGQQRTTTFIILSCVFRDFYDDDLGDKAKDYIKVSIQDRHDNIKRRLTLLTDENYQNTFEQTVLKKIIIDETGRKIPENKYLQNAHNLKNSIQEKLKEDKKININHFVEWIFENIALTTIICPNQDTAIQIFNVLNDRGMPLTSVDILKSFLMQRLSDEDGQAFKKKWDQINNKLENNDLNMEGLFNIYLYYAVSPNSKVSLHNELKKFFNKEKKDSLTIIHDTNEFSDAFIEVLTSQDKYVYCLRYLRHTVFWQSILTTAKFVKYKNIKQLKEILVAYYYLHWLNGSTLSRFKQTSLNIIKKIKENKETNEIQTEIVKNLKYWNIAFKNIDFEENISKQQWIKPTFLLLEYFSKDDSNQNFIELNNKTQIEHILPQNPKNGSWENFSPDDKKKWTNALANLTLLSKRKNVQARNDSFEKKKEVYTKSDNVATSFETTRQLFDTYNEWNKKILQDRQKKLIKKLKDILDIF